MGQKKYRVETVGPRIEAFLNSTRERIGLRVKFEVADGETPHPDFENPEIMVRFSGPDVELLLANKAELLLALEQLTMEMLRMPAEEHSLLCFDANDYRVLRVEELRLSALAAADKVKRTRVPFEFSPMNSRERRIIHLALRNEPTLRSESVGMAPHRHVVIYPSDMPSKPDTATVPAFARRGRRR
ncbi:MAG: hypothetical protein KJZ78_10505 [Bryobacteraceae bacterium]|nr:hypothetical protein [Bryobacteraceae bacterium]